MRAALIALLCLLVPAYAAAAEPTTLSLTATGQTRLAPDMATLTLGVTAEGPTAALALQKDAARMAEVIAALRRQGVAERDIQTTNLSVQAQYAFPQNQPRQLTGYQASNQVTVAVRELSRLGAVVDGVAGGGRRRGAAEGGGGAQGQGRSLRQGDRLHAWAAGQPLGGRRLHARAGAAPAADGVGQGRLDASGGGRA